MKFLLYILAPIIIILLTNLLKKRYLLNYSGDIHQKFLGKKSVPLTGGIYYIFSILLFYQNYLLNFFIFNFFCWLYFILKFIISPSKRFIIQTIINFIFILNVKKILLRF